MVTVHKSVLSACREVPIGWEASCTKAPRSEYWNTNGDCPCWRIFLFESHHLDPWAIYVYIDPLLSFLLSLSGSPTSFPFHLHFVEFWKSQKAVHVLPHIFGEGGKVYSSLDIHTHTHTHPPYKKRQVSEANSVTIGEEEFSLSLRSGEQKVKMCKCEKLVYASAWAFPKCPLKKKPDLGGTLEKKNLAVW